LKVKQMGENISQSFPELPFSHRAIAAATQLAAMAQASRAPDPILPLPPAFRQCFRQSARTELAHHFYVR